MALLVLAPLAAVAQDDWDVHPFLTDKFNVGLGVFFPDRSFSIGVNFAMTRHLGIGLAYNYFEVDVGIQDKNWRGDADISVNGPFVYLTASW